MGPNSSFHGRIDLQRIHSQIRNVIISNSLPPPKEKDTTNSRMLVCFPSYHPNLLTTPKPVFGALKFSIPLPKHTPNAIKTWVSRDKTSVTYDKKVTSAASEQKDKPQINSSLHCVRPTPASALGKVLFFLKEDGRTPLFQGRNKKKRGQQEHICMTKVFTSIIFGMLANKRWNVGRICRDWFTKNTKTIGPWVFHLRMFKSGDVGRDESIRPAFWVGSEQLKKTWTSSSASYIILRYQHHFLFREVQKCLVSHYLFLTIWNMFVVWSISESSQSIQCNKQAAVTIESLLLQPSQT